MPRRILLLITDLEIGGTPTVVRELAIRLRRATDVHVEVACLAKWGPVADQLRDAGVTVTAFGAKGVWGLPSVVRQLRTLVRERSIDTVFSFLVHANTVAAIGSRRLEGVRFFQSIQTTQPDPRWHWRVQGWVQACAEKIVVPSESVKRAAVERSLVPEEKVVVIPNAISSDVFSIYPRLTSDRIAIGFIGRLDPIKRIGDLLQAMTKLQGQTQLNIFGDGPDRSRIESEIARLNLSNRVILHGAIARPQDALAQTDLLVLPSEAEGFGLVLIEAMASGVPVVTTDVPGIRDVVRHEIDGLLVPVANPTELARAISRIIDDAGLRARLIENGLRGVRERFDWSNVLQSYRRLLGIETP